MKQTRKKHGAAFKAKVALAAIKSLPLRRQGATGPSPSWRARTGFTRTRSTLGRSSCLTERRAAKALFGPDGRGRSSDWVGWIEAERAVAALYGVSIKSVSVSAPNRRAPTPNCQNARPTLGFGNGTPGDLVPNGHDATRNCGVVGATPNSRGPKYSRHAELVCARSEAEAVHGWVGLRGVRQLRTAQLRRRRWPAAPQKGSVARAFS